MEVNNRVQKSSIELSLCFNGDFTLVYYEMGELEYFRFIYT